MCECGSALHIAQCPDARNIGLEAAVHLDIPTRVAFHPGFLQTQVFRIRDAAGSDKEMGTYKGRSALRALNRQDDLSVRFLNARRPGVQREMNALRFEDLSQFAGNFRVLAWQNLVAVMDDCHAAAEAPEHLPELEADVPSANHQQVIGDVVQLHDGGVCKIAGRFKSLDAGNGGTRARIDEDSLRFERLAADGEAVWTGEARLPAIETQVRALVHSALLSGAEAFYDPILARDNRGQINGYAICFHAPARCVARIVGDLGGSDHRLRRRATGVDAGPAQVRLFD